MKRLFPLLLTVLLLCGCHHKKELPQASKEIFAMDTRMTVTCCGERCEEALEASLSEIRRLDALLSTGNQDSEITKINQNKSAVLSEDTARILSEALRVFQWTDGAFDCTVYPVMSLWGFPTSSLSVPQEEVLAKTLETVGSDKIAFDPQTNQLDLQNAAGIDFGGIAKGYTSDRLMEIFRRYQLTSGCVSLGGNVQFYGAKPDGSLWRCGIKNPDEPESESYLGILSAKDVAVITSGAYERFFTDEKTGQIYHHIIDPKSGYPANSGLCSVTIVSASGIKADALSTAVFVLGFEKAEALWQAHSDTFDMILQTDEKTVYITESLADSFSSDFPIRIIRKK